MHDVRCPCCGRLLCRVQGGGAQIHIKCDRAQCRAMIWADIQPNAVKVTVLKFGRIKTIKDSNPKNAAERHD